MHRRIQPVGAGETANIFCNSRIPLQRCGLVIPIGVYRLHTKSCCELRNLFARVAPQNDKRSTHATQVFGDLFYRAQNKRYPAIGSRQSIKNRGIKNEYAIHFVMRF